MKLKHGILLLSILGTFTLYFLSALSQPISVTLCDLQQYEGKQVIVQGIVTNHYMTQYGSQLIEIHDEDQNQNITEAIIFVEKETAVEYGDRIQATGKVQRYRDEWEIVVEDDRFIQVVETWHNITIPLWQLAANPASYDGLNVNVSGIVDSMMS